jgi:hypothetical protein
MPCTTGDLRRSAEAGPEISNPSNTPIKETRPPTATAFQRLSKTRAAGEIEHVVGAMAVRQVDELLDPAVTREQIVGFERAQPFALFCARRRDEGLRAVRPCNLQGEESDPRLFPGSAPSHRPSGFRSR